MYDENGKLIETLTDDGTTMLDENGKKIPLVAQWISEFELWEITCTYQVGTIHF